MNKIKAITLMGLCFGLFCSWVNAEEKIFLGDLKPMKAKVGFGSYYVIRDGKPPNDNSKDFLVNGKPSQKGLFTHTDSEIVFAIPDGAKKFIAVGTMPNWQTSSRIVNGYDVRNGSWNYEVFIDGIQVYESEPLCAYVKKEVSIAVDIPENARQITLKNSMLGNFNADHAIWGEPYFIKP